MPIKPPSFNYGGGGGAFFGLIAQAMANKYRETPTQSAARERQTQKRSQRFQSEYQARGQQANTLSQIRAFDLGMQEMIARGQVLTPESAQYDPALQGKEIPTQVISKLGLPGISGIPDEQLGRPGYRILDPTAVSQFRGEYNPVLARWEAGGGEPLDMRTSTREENDFLRSNPELIPLYYAADQTDVDLTTDYMRGLSGMDDLIVKLQGELVDEAGNPRAITLGTLRDYMGRADAEYRIRTDRQNQSRLDIEWARNAMAERDEARRVADRVESWLQVAPTASVGDVLTGDLSSVLFLPPAVAMKMDEINREVQETSTPEEVMQIITQKQQELPGGDKQWSLSDLYLNHTPVGDAYRYGALAGTTTGGATGSPGWDDWTTQVSDNWDTWSTPQGRGPQYLQELRKYIRQNPQWYAELRRLGGEQVQELLPEDSRDLDTDTQLMELIEGDFSNHIRAAAMLASGDPSMQAWGSRAAISQNMEWAWKNPGRWHQYMPPPRLLKMYKHLLEAQPGGFDPGVWGPDPEGMMDEFIQFSEFYHNYNVATGGATPEERSQLGEAWNRIQMRTLEDVDLRGDDDMLSTLLRQSKISGDWVNPDTTGWTHQDGTSFEVARMNVALNAFSPEDSEAYREVVRQLASTSTADTATLVGLVETMKTYLPVEKSLAAQDVADWLDNVLQLVEETGNIGGFETDFKPAMQIALHMIEGGFTSPRTAARSYGIQLNRDERNQEAGQRARMISPGLSPSTSVIRNF